MQAAAASSFSAAATAIAPPLRQQFLPTASCIATQRSIHATSAAPRGFFFRNIRTPQHRSFASSTPREASYGFVGLGRMGYPMAKNLRSKIPKSDSLVVHDVNTTATEAFAKEMSEYGVEVAENVRQVAEKAETIITVLPEPKHVQGVFAQILSPATLLSSRHVSTKRLFIDCSTIDVKTSSEVASSVSSSGQGVFVDAPMSGGVVGAAAGGLTFMVGADDSQISSVSSVLKHMGKRVVHLGPQTSGLKGKLANNYLLALNNIATAEAMNMGVRWGIDPKVLADLINSATGKCWPSEVNNPVPGVCANAPAGRDYQGGFGTALMLKDLRLALQAGVEADIIPLLGAYAAQIYQNVEADEKCKGRDFSVVYRYLGGKE